MQYMGSKNRIAKYIIPIIQSYITEDTKGYLEPFVGGANVIDKIKHDNKIGCDIHKELIALLSESQTDRVFPITISEEEYIKVKNNRSEYEDWYVGFVGFFGSFGAKFFGGFARRYNEDGSMQDVPSQAIKSYLKQIPFLQNVKFLNKSFLELPIDKIKGYVVYCDPPYKGTTSYKTKPFPHDNFWDWVREMSKNNIVLVSEYNAPDDFECIWEKEHKTGLQAGKQQTRIEKLFIHRSNNYKFIKF